MKHRMIQSLAIMALLASVTPGCVAVYTANLPRPVNDQGLQLGMTHEKVAGVLHGLSYTTQFSDGSHVAYRYDDHEAWRWRWRSVVYFVTGPADFIFAPIEWAIHHAGQRWAYAFYDEEGQLVYFVSRDAGNTIEIELGQTPDANPGPRPHTFWNALTGATTIHEEN